METLSESAMAALLVVRETKYLRQRLKEIRDGRCPFCQIDTSINTILREGRHLRIWKNPFAHAHTRLHLVMAPRKHVIRLSDLGEVEGRELFLEMFDFARWAEREFSLHGYGLISRIGDLRYTAGSIEHLHINLVAPDLTGKVVALLARDPGEWAEQRAKFDEAVAGLDPEERAFLREITGGELG